MKQPSVDSNNLSNTVAIPTDIQFLRLLQIHDSAFPIGTYTQSYGMETYIQEDGIRAKEELIAFCTTFLHQNLVYGDAILIQEAFGAAKDQDIERLLHLEELCGAIKLAKESRDASVNLGRQFIRTVAPLVQDAFFDEWKSRIGANEIKGHYAILYGIYCAVNDVDAHHTVLSYLFSSVNGLVQNAVRAVPFGQNTGVQAMHQLSEEVVTAVRIVANLKEEDISNNALGIELASMKHEYLFSRLFIS
ncbi:urease accessory protein UreF [Sporosarcina thermotolerans]|uniref:Urease accessory protein UreF n=1 Tax=Sporosarcina thermotolerans TaxID=633404 RepID=A0AAW9AAE6_9BACL|nr:urease accessory protein UreF [Sporosarcina thermotolerans]MDW0116623.1 urease accessory protein UreF [Sporosarcina thermotolerans]WHT48828.1 urease accessory protein UreF [Sporosarcina thermotolerans]